MKLASWNVNSIRARLDRVVEWIDRNRPDVLCLQETKVADDLFPREPFESRGYQVTAFGQKTYNGVAIVSRQPAADVVRGLPLPNPDPGSRLLCATVADLRVVNVYVPNGRAVDSPYFAQKLDWLRRLSGYLDETARPSDAIVLCGDFNVAPEDRDVHDPAAYRDQVHCHPEERKALAEVAAFGLIDVVRRHHPESGLYSWWDYRQGAFHRNRGLRIDHVWATESVAARCSGAAIDRDARKGKQPSDHAPVIAEIA
ncbi:MAG: exodeoxyribonuclease III [Deltaproteobacteria bacterium]|nr:exodeoxyribonuclease III [Deltaproteobacteria bacterium]